MATLRRVLEPACSMSQGLPERFRQGRPEAGRIGKSLSSSFAMDANRKTRGRDLWLYIHTLVLNRTPQSDAVAS